MVSHLIVGWLAVGYLAMTGLFIHKGDWPMSVVWVGYSVAHVGFIWQALK